MPWVRLDDTFPEHPQIEQAGPLGLALHVAALCYSNRNLTDGFLPASVVRRLLALDDVDEVIRRLIAAGVWQECDGGYRLVLGLNRQPSRSDVEALRAKRAEYGRRGGVNSGASRRARSATKQAAKAKPKQPATAARPKCIHGVSISATEDGATGCATCDEAGAKQVASASVNPDPSPNGSDVREAVG